jgi:hypothetical protein
LPASENQKCPPQKRFSVVVNNNVSRKAGIAHDHRVFLLVWKRDIAKPGLVLDSRQVTKEDAPPEIDKGYGGIFPSNRDNLGVPMEKVAFFILVFLEVLIRQRDVDGGPGLELGVVEVEDEVTACKRGPFI